MQHPLSSTKKVTNHKKLLKALRSSVELNMFNPTYDNFSVYLTKEIYISNIAPHGTSTI